jgi:hypothetical protein
VETRKKAKSINNLAIINALSVVGMTRFELATTRPPDVAYSSFNNLDYQYL